MYGVTDSLYSQGQPILVEYHIFSTSTDRWDSIHLNFNDWLKASFTDNFNTIPRRYALKIAFEYKKYSQSGVSRITGIHSNSQSQGGSIMTVLILQICLVVLCILLGALLHNRGNNLKSGDTQYLLDLRDRVVLIPMLFVVTFVLFAPPTNPYDIVIPCLIYAIYFTLSNIIMYFIIRNKYSSLSTES